MEASVQPAESTIFTDAKGRQWDTRLTLAGAKRIDDSNFTALGMPEDFTILKPSRDFFTTILNDTSVTFAMIWSVVHPQTKNHKDFPDPQSHYDEAEQEFLEGLDGKTIEAGRNAFWRAISDFFPQHRTVLLTLMQSYQQAVKRLQTSIANMDHKITKALESEVEKELAELENQLEVVGK